MAIAVIFSRFESCDNGHTWTPIQWDVSEKCKGLTHEEIQEFARDCDAVAKIYWA